MTPKQKVGHLILGLPDSPEQRRFLGRLLQRLAIFGLQLASIPIVATLADDPGAEDMQGVALVAIGTFMVLSGPMMKQLSERFGPAIWPFVIVYGCGFAVVLPFMLGRAWAEAGAFVVIFIGGGSHTFFRRGPAWVCVAVVVAAWCTTMAVLGGPDAIGRMLIGSVLGLVAAFGLDRVLDRLAAANAAERDARAAADVACAALSETSERKGQFLARVSHELRTPLNAVLGFSGMIHEGVAGPMSEKQADYIDEVVASGTHLLALVDDVLHLSRIEAGTDELVSRPFDLSALVERSTALFRDQAARTSVRLTTEVPAGIAVVADERKVRQVVFNLVSNAVRFAPPDGSVIVTLRREAEEVVIEVRDSGPGIDPGDHERIFEPFQQAPTGHGNGGTGLGLSVARRFAELHGGSCSVRSALGAGATFDVRLPVDASTATRAPEVTITSGALADDGIRRTTSELVRVLSASTAVGATALVSTVALLSPPDEAGPAGLAIVACGLLVAVAIALAARPRRTLGAGAAHLLIGALVVAVPLAVAGAGSLGFVTANGLSWVAFCSVSLLPRRWVVGYGLAAAAGVGLVMATRPGFSTPALRWEALCLFSAALAGIILPLVDQLHTLTRSEASARAATQATAVAIEAATQHKSEFVATMSHELRTPLNAIIGFSEALREEVFGPITAKQAEYLDDILAADQHLLALVNDVLDLAKLDAGQMPEPRSEVDLGSLVDASVAGLVRLGLPAPSAVEVGPDLPPVTGDGRVLARVLTEIAAWVADRAADPASVRIAVLQEDGGVRATASAIAPPGIDTTDAFTELPPGPSDTRRGTGLGMAIVERQVHRHGGWCQAGATAGVVAVSVWLPAVAMPPATSRPSADDTVREAVR